MSEGSSPKDYSKHQTEVDGAPVGVTSYWQDDRYVVVVDNVSPGATIARAEGDSLERTERDALALARERLLDAERRHATLRDLRESVEKLERAVRSRR